MEVREQVSALSWKMKSPFHTARAAELWNSFPVGGSGGKRGKELRGRAPSLPEGMGRGAADGSTWQDPMAQSPSRSGFLGPEVGWGKERLRSNRCSPQSRANQAIPSAQVFPSNHHPHWVTSREWKSFTCCKLRRERCLEPPQAAAATHRL